MPSILESTPHSLGRSPTLHTVLMIEHFIKDSSEEYTRRELWKLLPRKVMWQTYLIVLAYLESINKIIITDDGKVVYIWNPDLATRLSKRKEALK